MLTSTISSKGQTTIPMDVQRLLKVKPGDKLQYFLEADGRVSLLPKTLSVKDLEGILPKPEKTVSIKQMDAAVQKEAAARYRRSKKS
ncbi:MAG: AbrB family transcriptional regulator [Cyanothece sp. SIO1E1]|nr:AbrB family transcriptional regulator [Cyanothece sp. SIO1E1]